MRIEDRRIYEKLEFSVSIMFFELSIDAKGHVLSAKRHRYVLPSLAAICGLFLQLYDLCPLTLYECHGLLRRTFEQLPHSEEILIKVHDPN